MHHYQRKIPIFSLFFSFILLFSFYGCTHLKKRPSEAGKMPLRLNAVALDKKSFNPSRGEKVLIRCKPSVTCYAEVTIYDCAGERVGELIREAETKPEGREIVWDGLNDKGRIVPNGVYFYVIELITDNNERFLYNPYPRTHGKIVKNITGGFDEEAQKVRMTLPQASMVRIRAGLKNGGPHLVTPLNWRPFASGNYSVSWDGKDASGLIEVASHPDKKITIFSYALADNSIIVSGGHDLRIIDDHRKRLDIATLKKTQHPSESSFKFHCDLPADRHAHAICAPHACHEPRINVDILSDKQSPEGLPIIQGIVPLKVSIAPEDQYRVENSGYEIMLFIDTVFLFEDEAGFTPFTYLWDTQAVPEGEHLVTVNLLTYDHHCGVCTEKVIIKRGE